MPAKTNMVVAADGRAQAAAGEGITVGRRVHTVRHGQGKTAWAERQETEGVGITGLTTYDPYGSPEHGRQQHRRDFQPNLINAVVVRQWRGKNYGPGGKTVFLTHASVTKPLQPCDDDDERSLIEHGCIKEAKQPWDLGHPPQKTDRAVRVHVIFALLMFALATAYRLPCEREARGGESVGWQRWRRQLLEQTRDQVIVFAQGSYGIFHLAEYSLLLGVKLKDVSRPRLAAASRSWPSMSSHHRADRYVGTSVFRLQTIDSSLNREGSGGKKLFRSKLGSMIRVLAVHSYYQQRAGGDVVFAAEVALLRQHRHEVVEYTQDNRYINGMSQLAVAAHDIGRESTPYLNDLFYRMWVGAIGEDAVGKPFFCFSLSFLLEDYVRMNWQLSHHSYIISKLAMVEASEN